MQNTARASMNWQRWKGEGMTEWKIIKYANTQQAGPVSAIDAVAEELDAKGIDYTVIDMGVMEAKPGTDMARLLEGDEHGLHNPDQ